MKKLLQQHGKIILFIVVIILLVFGFKEARRTFLVSAGNPENSCRGYRTIKQVEKKCGWEGLLNLDTYHSETVETKYVSGSGYAGNQPANGVRFTTGGSFFWAETGGPTLDASVTFSDPLQIVSVTIDLGVKSNSSTGYIVNVPSTDAFYKLHVYKVMRVDKYVTYQTSLITGETRVYMTLYPKTMDSYTLSAVQV